MQLSAPVGASFELPKIVTFFFLTWLPHPFGAPVLLQAPFTLQNPV
jgi:hypothetical protein